MGALKQGKTAVGYGALINYLYLNWNPFSAPTQAMSIRKQQECVHVIKSKSSHDPWLNLTWVYMILVLHVVSGM